MRDTMKTYSDIREALPNLPDASKVSYTGVVLFKKSHEDLVAAMREHIPEGWKIVAHHMTIKMGALKPTDTHLSRGGRKDIGMTVGLKVEGWAIDDRTVTVKVSGQKSVNPHPHITVAVNVTGGGKPKDSNLHNKWNPMGRTLSLTGRIMEALHNETVPLQ